MILYPVPVAESVLNAPANTLCRSLDPYKKGALVMPCSNRGVAAVGRKALFCRISCPLNR